jgi:hypothetical protein
VIRVPRSASDDRGVPVDELIDAVKRAVKQANISATDPGRDLAVTAVTLRLNTVATRGLGGSIDFRVPLIGVRLTAGGSVTRQDTHLMELTLIPDHAPVIETRGVPVDVVLVEAIETVRAVMARAAAGDDPFVLRDGTVELSFGVASDGSIALGIDGELKDEVTHAMRLTIARPPA